MRRTMSVGTSSDRSLAERLQAIAEAVRAASSEFADAVDVFVDRIVAAEAGRGGPAIGEALPNFLLPDQDGKLVVLQSLLAEGPVVVAFLRGHWCPYCQTTAAALAEIADEVRALGGCVVAITPEKRKFAGQIHAENQGAYSVLSDVDNGYAVSLNLSVWVDPALADLIAQAGIDVPTYQGNPNWVLPIPAIFLLDKNGIIAARHVNPDFRERADLDAVLNALRALG